MSDIQAGRSVASDDPVVVIAPHFDDAAFSTAQVLIDGGAEVTVITVCGGSPGSVEISEWDAECGFTSAEDAATARIAEDDAACVLTGAQALRLQLTDAPYRSEFPADQVAAELARLLPASGPVWIPAGIGNHPDHTGTRDAALELLSASEARVRFYADCPYAFAFGWHANDTDRDADHRWAEPLARIRRFYPRAEAQWHRLGPAAIARKLDLVRCHRSQIPPMALEFPGLLASDGPLRTELYWSATPSRKVRTYS